MSEPRETVVLLPGATLLPEVLLHRLLENKAAIASMVTIVHYADGTCHACWSHMTREELVMAERQLHHQVDEAVFGD